MCLQAAHQSAAVMGIALVSMGEDLGRDMAHRSMEHLLQYGDPFVRFVPKPRNFFSRAQDVFQAPIGGVLAARAGVHLGVAARDGSLSIRCVAQHRPAHWCLLVPGVCFPQPVLEARRVQQLYDHVRDCRRRGVPLAIALLNTSNPGMGAMDMLSRLSHDSDIEVGSNAILALGAPSFAVLPFVLRGLQQRRCSRLVECRVQDKDSAAASIVAQAP